MRGPRFMLDHRFTQRRASAVIDGELAPHAQRRAERHASICPVCRELLASLRATVGRLAGLRAGDEQVEGAAAARVADRVVERLRRE